MRSESVLFMLSSNFCWYIGYSAEAWMIFKVNLTVRHQKLILNNLHILLPSVNRIGFRQNDSVIKDVHKQFTHLFAKLISKIFQTLSLSWCISKSIYRIWEVEVSKSESTNKYSKSKNIQKIKQKAIVWLLVKREYFLCHPVHTVVFRQQWAKVFLNNVSTYL